jgi:hypothetical protein
MVGDALAVGDESQLLIIDQALDFQPRRLDQLRQAFRCYKSFSASCGV